MFATSLLSFRSLPVPSKITVLYLSLRSCYLQILRKPLYNIFEIEECLTTPSFRKTLTATLFKNLRSQVSGTSALQSPRIYWLNCWRHTSDRQPASRGSRRSLELQHYSMTVPPRNYIDELDLAQRPAEKESKIEITTAFSQRQIQQFLS
jgi:hypothetical protein